MKRLISNVRYSAHIFGMAVIRQKAVEILKKNDDMLSEHIIKCVVYGNSTRNYKHWVEDEISDYIRIANDVYLKPTTSKPKRSMFEDTIFAAFGDSIIDAERNLAQFNVDNRRSGYKYPKFDIDDDMIQRLYKAYQNLMKLTLPILCSKNSYVKDDFIPIVYRALDV